MYRTGDLVMWDEPGVLVYAGRADDQLQVRGIRVELAELEAILEGAPGVRQAAVRPVAEEAGRADALVAYLVFTDEKEPTPAALREHLGQYVQEAVIPSQFVQLEAMPRTPSGKIDRRALADSADMLRAGERVTPQTETERAVAAIWRTHLGLDEIGVNENFFEVGGHSLLAIRVQHDLISEFGVDVEAGFVFDFPSVAEQASQIEILLTQDVDLDEMMQLLEQVENAGLNPDEFG
jgi:hypothetical protein